MSKAREPLIAGVAVVAFTLVTQAATQRIPVDKTKPARVEVLVEVRQGGKPVGTILETGLTVMDGAARARATKLANRWLVKRVDGQRFALYSYMDFTGEKEYVTRSLFVDVNRSEWVLLTIRGKSEKPGYGAFRKLAEENQPALIGFETRRLRMSPESEEHLEKARVAEVFRTAEPELVELIQNFRRWAPKTMPSARFTAQVFADYLSLPEVAPCSECEVLILDKKVANDTPDRPATPLAPEFEEEFGRWVSWPELPRLRDQ